MREIEWKLLSELMRNSRRSDRDLARVIDSSQPTVNRRRKRLEEKGYIKEYTMIPDFAKLGYELMVLTFVKLKKELTPEAIEKARELAFETLKTGPFEVVMCERGIGMGYRAVFVSFHEDYASYMKFLEWLRQFQFLQIYEIGNFIVNLKDEIHYRPLTFSTLAKHLLTLEEKKG